MNNPEGDPAAGKTPYDSLSQQINWHAIVQ